MRKKYNTPHRRHVVKTRMTDEEYADFTGGLEKEVRGAAADLAALKFEVLQKVGEAVGDTQTYQL